MRHTPDERYVGWPSLVYGGLIGCLIDCHSNWTVMANHYRAEKRETGTLPRIDCVTSVLNVKYIKPTPMGVPLLLKARVDGEVGRKTRVIFMLGYPKSSVDNIGADELAKLKKLVRELLSATDREIQRAIVSGDLIKVKE